jgi:HK97 family phage prohead protease
MPKFILSDESVNKYGFRVLTSGIQLDAFMNNPVMFYNHDRENLPIGKWTNIKVEGTKLTADPEFDTNDEFAMKIKDKVDKGIINCASIGFDILETSFEQALLVDNQIRPTVTKCCLFETSIVDIPGNSNSIKMRGIELRGNITENEIELFIPKISTHNLLEMKETAKLLGLADTATEAEINAAITKLQTEKLRAEGNSENGLKVLLSLAENKGFKKETIEKLAKADFNAAFDLVNDAPAKDAGENITQTTPKGGNASLTDLVTELRKSSGTAPTEMKFSEMLRKNPAALEAMERENPTQWKALYKAEYGVEPSL